VRSPKTGTHYVGLTQFDTERYYLRAYTVDVADTWETKTVTFPGDTSGVINSDTGEGLRLFFALYGRGGNFGGGTADAWTAWPAGVIQYMASDSVNVLDNTANNFYLTGVQLEVGSVATDFEHEPYSTTLAKCFRYFYRITEDSPFASTGAIFAFGSAAAGTNVVAQVQLPVPMRAVPSVAVSAATDISVVPDGTDNPIAVSLFGGAYGDTTHERVRLSFGLTGATQYRPYHVYLENGSAGWIHFVAEL